MLSAVYVSLCWTQPQNNTVFEKQNETKNQKRLQQNCIGTANSIKLLWFSGTVTLGIFFHQLLNFCLPFFPSIRKEFACSQVTSEKRSSVQRKEFLGCKFFPLRVDPFSEGSKPRLTELLPHESFSSPFKHATCGNIAVFISVPLLRSIL